MHVDKYEQYWIIAFVSMLGVFVAALLAGAIIFGVRVPTPQGFVDPSNLQDTEFANPGVRDMGDNEYEVWMIARMWQFQPAELSFPVGSEVTFNVTSADVTHGFIIEHHNANLEIVPGHIAQARVTFNEPGIYRIQCHEYCGLEHHSMYMPITITEATDEE